MLVLAAACGGSDDGASPSAVLTSVEPACARSASATPLTIRGTMPVKPVVSLSDENESTLEIGYRAFIGEVPLMGDVPLAEVLWVDAETLTAVVPSSIPPGHYPLTVENPFGERTVLESFQVTDGACTAPPVPGNGLEITADAAPATVRPGEVVVVTATVRNSGQGTATEVATTVAAPPGFEPFTSPSDRLTIPSGGSRTFTWTYTAVAGAGNGTFAVTAAGVDLTTGEAITAPQASTNSVAVVYAVGGSVTGLRGSGLVLRLNGTTDVAVANDGPFSFGTFASGTSFAVTIATQPTGPAQTCTVSGASGTVGTGPVTSVVVNCDVNTFTVGGTVTGLAGSGLVLHEGTTNQDVAVSAESFAFPAPLRSGVSYAVTVGTQPTNPAQTCTVVNGTGTVGGANVTDVSVSCSTNPVALTTATSGTGSGSILCNGVACQPSYLSGTTIAITALPAPGSTFTSWAGDCTGAGPCALTMTQDRTVTATFTVQTFTLSATTSGTGTGSILCNGAACAASYPFSTTPLTITAVAAPGSTFTGWGGACSGAGQCTVTMTANQTVTATFTQQTFTLTAVPTPAGSGSVLCNGGACQGSYPFSTTPIALTPQPATGWTFAGWSGDCTGVGTCSVTMTANHSVTANFTPQVFTLTTTTNGTGAGSILCNGAPCASGYPFSETPITITAVAETGSTFTGWGGDCSGVSQCTVTMTANHTVTATFTLQEFNLATATTSINGGTGTLICNGVDCANLGSYPYGSTVTITYRLGLLSEFAGWFGDCAGTIGDTCVLTMTGPRSVTAAFDSRFLGLTTSVTGDGSGDIFCDDVACQETYPANTSVRLTAVSAENSTIQGWTGDCSGRGTCTVSMDRERAVAAEFGLQTS